MLKIIILFESIKNNNIEKFINSSVNILYCDREYILNFSLEISLEKYMKIINSPLIIIRNIKIEKIKFIFQIDMFIQISKLNKIINIIIIIGWICLDNIK